MQLVNSIYYTPPETIDFTFVFQNSTHVSIVEVIKLITQEKIKEEGLFDIHSVQGMISYNGLTTLHAGNISSYFQGKWFANTHRAKNSMFIGFTHVVNPNDPTDIKSTDCTLDRDVNPKRGWDPKTYSYEPLNPQISGSVSMLDIGFSHILVEKTSHYIASNADYTKKAGIGILVTPEVVTGIGRAPWRERVRREEGEATIRN